MVGELIFHLGDCKTGTTSIQAALAKRLWRAEGRSISYNVPFNHIPMARSLSADPEERRRRWMREAEALARSGADWGIVSAEHFEFVSPEHVRLAIEEFMPAWRDRLRLVAYVRPHLDRFLSTYAERTKKGEIDLDPPAFARQILRRRRLHYHGRFTRWREVFGDRFTLRPFVREELEDGDVVADFFAFVGGRGTFRLEGAEPRNPSLSVEDLAMMRHIHRRLAERGEGVVEGQRAFGWNFSEILARLGRPDGGTPLRLHAPLARELAEAWAEDAALLDRDFFGGRAIMVPALAHSVERAIPEAQSTEPALHHGPEALRLFDCLADLLGRMVEADPPGFLRAVSSPEYRVPPLPPEPAPSETEKPPAPAPASRPLLGRALGLARRALGRTRARLAPFAQR
ncbi:hypothetical protein [Rubellimicrobium sp. CFH 75288]|uniref:hypothetical protein n=1 Tax=Rubellimicrobium sp. CFH 75288 TaxID=2697034 RepID=UPI001413726F|nr:hypothetical protein [Rubellimicrobium sp. CFH 75288]NAZ38188.1 hypothetical protein [Rubellimicrobium sp. CFH 75288]